VRDLLRRCLQKEPEKRLGDLAEARRDIDACLAAPFRIPFEMLESVRWSLTRPAVRASLAAVAIVVAGLALYQFRNRDVPVPRLTNPVQVTGAIGVEGHPTWSPDSRTMAYDSNETGNWDIWLVQADGGQAVNRTTDHRGTDR
jgi:hypothetical protein